jgi:hypothetical protein
MSWESASRHRAHDLAPLRTVDVVGPTLPLSLGFFFPHPAQMVRLLPDAEGRDAFSHPYSPWDAAMTMPSYTLVRWVPLVRLMHCRNQRSRDHLFPGLAQLVLNIPFNSEDTLEALDPPYILPFNTPDYLSVDATALEGSRGPEEVVYIFHPGKPTVRYEPPSLEFHSDMGKPRSYGSYHLLEGLATALMLNLKDGLRVTVVGVEALASPWLKGGGDDNPQSNFYMRCAMAAQSVYLNDVGELEADEVTDALDTVEFHTLEAYRTMIGPERAALETTLEGVL